MRFQTYQPCAALKEEIACFIVSENSASEPYAVLPDTALVIGFQYRGRLSVVRDSQGETLAAAGITGLLKGVRHFRNEGHVGTVLVRFKPGGIAAFLGLPAHELLEQSLSLDALIDSSSISLIEERLLAAEDDKARIGIVEAFLLSRRREVKADSMVNEAVRLIQESSGRIRMAELARQLSTSASPLEKRFRSRIGASPKAFANIIRFRSVINLGKKGGSAASRAYEAGYFDQAHFIKDFRRFSGQTPEDFFSAGAF